MILSHEFLKGLLEAMIVELKEYGKLHQKCQEEMLKYMIEVVKSGDQSLETTSLFAISFLRVEPKLTWTTPIFGLFTVCLRFFYESRGKKMRKFMQVFLLELRDILEDEGAGNSKDTNRLLNELFWPLMSILTMPIQYYPEISYEALQLLWILLDKIPLNGKGKIEAFTVIGNKDSQFRGIHPILARYMYEQPFEIELTARFCLLKLWTLMPKSAFDPSQLSFLYVLLGCSSWICIQAEQINQEPIFMDGYSAKLLRLVSFYRKILLLKCAKEAEEIISGLDHLIQTNLGDYADVEKFIKLTAINISVLFVPEVVHNLEDYLINMLSMTGRVRQDLIRNYVFGLLNGLVEKNGADLFQRSLSVRDGHDQLIIMIIAVGVDALS